MELKCDNCGRIIIDDEDYYTCEYCNQIFCSSCGATCFIEDLQICFDCLLDGQFIEDDL